MNKKGFTLVELLAVIVILSLIMTIGFYSVTGITNGIRQKALETKIKSLETTAIKYGHDHTNVAGFFTGGCEVNGESSNFCREITVSVLVEAGAFETEETDTTGKKTVTNNVTGESMMDKIIKIYKKNNRIYAIYIDE